VLIDVLIDWRSKLSDLEAMLPVACFGQAKPAGIIFWTICPILVRPFD
jgi:hypothetical protein